MSFIDKCRHVIGLDSTPSRGTREIGEYFASLCKEAGLEVLLDNESYLGVDQVNLYARPFGTLGSKADVIFQSHIDTEDPGNMSAWIKTKGNPFNASIYGDELVGLGAASGKLDFLCKIEAFKSFGQQIFQRSPVLIGTYGAHLGMAGAIKSIRKKRVNGSLAFVGAPTGLKLAHSSQGLAVLEVNIPFSKEEIDYRKQHDESEIGSSQSKLFKGKAAHSSEPELGENAIVKMLEYLAQLPLGIAIMNLDGGTAPSRVPESAFLEIDIVGTFKDPIVQKLNKIIRVFHHIEKLAQESSRDGNCKTSKVNIGTIRTYNDSIRIQGICQIPPRVDDERYLEWMKIIEGVCDETGSRFMVTDYKPSFTSPNNGEGINILKKVFPEIVNGDFELPLSSEASVFSRFGIETLVLGPGLPYGNLNTPDESISILKLEEAINIYKSLIREFCL